MFGRKKLLEERIAAAVEAEFEGLISELEMDLAEYRRRARARGRAWVALERAEAEARRVQDERVLTKKRFWEAYYGEEDQATLSAIEREHRSLKRAMKKAERSLKKARENFEKADFDEAAERAALREKAYAAEEKTDLRIGELEKDIEVLLAETWRSVKELSVSLRGLGEEPQPLDAGEEEEIDHRRSA